MKFKKLGMLLCSALFAVSLGISNINVQAVEDAVTWVEYDDVEGNDSVNGEVIEKEDIETNDKVTMYEAEYNDSRATANTAEVGDWYADNVDASKSFYYHGTISSSDVDYYKVFLSAGVVHEFYLSSYMDKFGASSLKIVIEDASGNVCGKVSDKLYANKTSFYKFKTSTTGYYYVKFYNYAGSSKSYTFSVDRYYSSNTPTPTPTPKPVKEGWQQNANGYWYQNADGSYPKNCWKQIDGKQYHFNANGYMETNKWISDTYWVKSNGVMATNEWVDGGKYYVGSDGKWVQGKVNVKEGWQQNATGYWYQNADGSYPKSCWKQIDGKQYHFNANGYMETNKWISDTYWVKSNGVMATDEWVDGGKYYVGSDGKWVAGKVKEGWQQDSNGWWYQNSDGTYPKSNWKQIDGDWYHFNARGYMESNCWIGNYWLLSNGKMATNAWVDGGKYYVGADGVWVPNKTK